MTDWISIEDRLPDLPPKECGGTIVRIYATCGNGHLNQDAVYTYYGRFIIGTIYDEDITNYVTHWMPTPAPPKIDFNSFILQVLRENGFID